MDRSFGANREIKCPHCDTSFDFKIWQIVDTCERPDLYEKIIDDSLHDAYCPTCNAFVLKNDSRLLVYRSNQEPKFIFSPDEETVAEVDKILFLSLMDHFKSDLGPEWPSNWQIIVKAPIPREILSLYLREGSKAAEIAYIEIARKKAEVTEQVDNLLKIYAGLKTERQKKLFIIENYQLITSFRSIGVLNEIIYLSTVAKGDPKKLIQERDKLIYYRKIGLEKTTKELYEVKPRLIKTPQSKKEIDTHKPSDPKPSSTLMKHVKRFLAHLMNGRKTDPNERQHNRITIPTPLNNIDRTPSEKPSTTKNEDQLPENNSAMVSFQPVSTSIDQIDSEHLQSLLKELNEDSDGNPKLPESEIRKLISKLFGDYEASQDDPSIPKIIIAVAWVAEPDQEVIELTKNLLFDYRLRMAEFNNVRILEFPTKITTENGKQTAKILRRQHKVDIVVWLQRSGVGEFDVFVEIFTNHHLDVFDEEVRLRLNTVHNLPNIQFRISQHESIQGLYCFLSGLAIFQDRFYPQAIDIFTDTISLSNSNDSKQILAVALFYRALSKMFMKEFNDAISDLSEAIKYNPDNSRFYSTRGSAFGLVDQRAKEIEDFSYAIFLDPTDSNTYFNRGQTYSEDGKSKEAISDFSNCIKNDPTNSEAYFLRGCEYGKMRQEDLAIADFSKTIELNPKKSEAYGNRGWAYNIKGDRNSAIEDYTMALAINPNDEDTLSKRGEAYRHVGEIDKSLADLNHAIGLDQTHSDSFLARGLSYVKKGEITKAFADLNKAVQLDPQNADAIAMRGNLYGMMGNRDKAVEDLEIAAKLNPKYVDLLISHKE